MSTYETNEQSSSSKEWKKKLFTLKSKYGIINASYKNSEDRVFKEEEPGIFSKSGSMVKLYNDGSIDIFALPSLGIRLDPANESINLIGKKVTINSQNFDVETNPIYFRFNSQPIDINQLSVKDKKLGQIHTEEFKTILKEMGFIDE